MSNDITIYDTHLPASQFDEVVHMIVAARGKAYRMVNTALIDMYWHVGEYISAKIAQSEWGESVVIQLAQYIATTIPGIKGFSDKNLWRMKQFYETYRNADEKLSTLLRELQFAKNQIVRFPSPLVREIKSHKVVTKRIA